MVNNATLQIEELKLKIDSPTPYKDAFLLFMEKNNIYDPEDLLEIVDKILFLKLKQEFIDTNNIPSLKENNLTDFFS